MKKLLAVLVAAVIIAGLIFGSTLVASSASDFSKSNLGSTAISPAASPGPTVVLDTQFVKWSKKTKMQIMGYGFKTGQELHLMVTDANGVVSDFTMYDCKPSVKVTKQGVFGTEWTGAGRMISKKLLNPGAYVLEVTDENYKTLASTPFFVGNKPKK